MPTYGGVGNTPGSDATLEEIRDYLVRLDRALEFHQNNIDGENLLDWRMTVPGSTTVRAWLGYNKGDGAFHFTLYNSTGVATVDINSAGNAVFTGLVTGSSVVGGTIRTGTSNGARIQLSSNALVTYDSSNKKDGPSWGSVNSAFGEIVMFADDVAIWRMNPAGPSGGAAIQPLTTDAFSIGSVGTPLQFSGLVQVCDLPSDTLSFFAAVGTTRLAVVNLSTATAAATYGANEQSMLQTASNTLNSLIATLHTYGLV